MTRISNIICMLSLLSFMMMTGCTEDPPPDPEPTDGTLKLEFMHVVNGGPISYFTLDHTNEAGNLYSIYSLRYLISNIALIREDGTKLRLEDTYVYINAVDGRNTAELSDIEFDTFIGIEFQIGLDEEVNGADPGLLESVHPLNPILNGMHWSWTQGYRFIVLEGQYEKSDSSIDAYSYHIGDDENKFTLSFSTDAFQFNSDMTAQFTFEINELFKNPNIYDLEADGSFTHSGNDGGIAATLVENLGNAWTLDGIN